MTPSGSIFMTETKQQKVQRKLNHLIGSTKLTPDEAIGMLLSAALGIMGQVYRKPDGNSLTPDEVKRMMIQGLADSLHKGNGVAEPPALAIVDTPEAAADMLEKAAQEAGNIEKAKPISTDEAMNILEKEFRPQGSELQG